MTDLCPNKKLCGSCGWSHIPYEKQLKQKLSDINGSFKIKGLEIKVAEIVPSPITEHYRNRMDFVIDFERRVGLRKKGKWWKVIDNHKCFIADEMIEKLFDVVRAWVKECGLSCYDRKANVGLLRYAVIRSATTGEAMVTIVTSSPVDEDEADSIREALIKLVRVCEEPATKSTEGGSASGGQSTSIIHSINSTISDVSFGDKLETISSAGYIEEIVNGLRYRITPNAFFQTNTRGAAILMDTIREFAGDLSGKTLLDLYCGSGFFAVALAGEAKRVVGVELVAEAIRDARVNAELNNAEVEFYEAAAENFDWSKYGADVVILDPPRSGMHDKMLEEIMRARPETIVYVSCNYKNFARELARLQNIYNVEAIRAIDMFPHTPHVELVTKLVRK